MSNNCEICPSLFVKSKVKSLNGFFCQYNTERLWVSWYTVKQRKAGYLRMGKGWTHLPFAWKICLMINPWQLCCYSSTCLLCRSKADKIISAGFTNLIMFSFSCQWIIWKQCDNASHCCEEKSVKSADLQSLSHLLFCSSTACHATPRCISCFYPIWCHMKELMKSTFVTLQLELVCDKNIFKM